MSKIFIPEAILLDSVKKFIKFVATNFKSKVNENETWLYKVLVGTQKIDRYEIYQEAKQLFIAGYDDPKKLAINLGFNPSVQGLPSIHITLPSEQQKNTSLGNGEGIGASFDNGAANTYQVSYSRRFEATYYVMVSGTNTLQVVTIYHVLRALFISLRHHLEIAGLENTSFSGRDIQFNPDTIPQGLFVRGIGIKFEYDTGAYDIQELPFIKDLNFSGKAVD
jgi:hypothetical protein